MFFKVPVLLIVITRSVLFRYLLVLHKSAALCRGIAWRDVTSVWRHVREELAEPRDLEGSQEEVHNHQAVDKVDDDHYCNVAPGQVEADHTGDDKVDVYTKHQEREEPDGHEDGARGLEAAHDRLSVGKL